MPGDWVLDFFAGSGTTGAVARQLERHFVLVDTKPDAFDVMRTRFQGADGIDFVSERGVRHTADPLSYS